MTVPWRGVAYIGVQRGDHDGLAWALVLDVCGHTVFRSIPPFRCAPKRVRCYHCGYGHAPLDLDAALATARRLYERSLDLL